MKTFYLKQTGTNDAGKGELTQQILEFLIYDGDATMYINNSNDYKMILKKMHEHKLYYFIESRGNKKLVQVNEEVAV